MLPEFDTLHAEFVRVNARMKNIHDEMEPYSAIQAAGVLRMREQERFYRMAGEYERLLAERDRISTALDRLRPGWNGIIPTVFTPI